MRLSPTPEEQNNDLGVNNTSFVPLESIAKASRTWRRYLTSSFEDDRAPPWAFGHQPRHSMPGYNPETYLLHPESDFSGGHLQDRSNELARDIHSHYLCLPCLAPHDGVAQQPLLHHLRARVTRHPTGASGASRRHNEFAGHLTVDVKDFDSPDKNQAMRSWPSTVSRYYGHKLQSPVSSIAPLSFYGASYLFCTQTSVTLHPNVHKKHPCVTCCPRLR